MAQDIQQSLHDIYTKREWRIAGVLFVSYVAIHCLIAYFVPAAALLDPASAVALTSLYFGGWRLWPVVYII